MKNVLNFLLFQITWFICVWSVGKEVPYYGLIFMGGVFLFHFFYMMNDRKKESLLMLKVILFGGVVEIISSKLGGIAFKNTPPYFSHYPPYMWGMWLNLGITFQYSMHWLKGRYFLGFLFGGVFAPLSYYGAGKLGALNLAWDSYFDLIKFSLIWATTMLFLIYFFINKSYQKDLITR